MHKKILNTSITGERGVALIHQRILEMGHLWHPYGQVEAGVDGLIELRIPETSEATNAIIQVQSRATEKSFDNETDSTFEYRCSEADLSYWLQGNCPIILIRSRPNSNEIYWKNLKAYFSTPELKAKRKVIFDKEGDRFDKDASRALLDLAVPVSVGLSIPVPKSPEMLYSNLVPIRILRPELFVGSTRLRNREEAWAAVNRDGITDKEWILSSNSNIVSFRDLGLPLWSNITDSVERHESKEWFNAADILIQNEARELLRRCVSVFLDRRGLIYSKTAHCYYFKPSKDLRAYEYDYSGITNETSREVFGPHGYKKAISFYRHSAVSIEIEILDGAWYLILTPTYYFTFDGHREDKFREVRLSKMRRLDRHAAVFGQLVMWQRFFVEGDSLFAERYPFLEFGELLTANSELTIPDSYWQNCDANKDVVPEDFELDLFETN